MRVIAVNLADVGEDFLDRLAHLKSALLETRPGIVPSLAGDDGHTDTIDKSINEAVLVGFVLHYDATYTLDSVNVVNDLNWIAHISPFTLVFHLPISRGIYRLPCRKP
ncbi:MAG: hypothetical protein II011_00595 [Prevotella sp.]|nr:hypothetical protein [Prevotella sp.]